MATPTDTICEVCHERRATHFVCYGGTGKSSHLCDECFESSTPPEVRQSAAAVRDAHCQYCGGQPCAGGTDFLALATGVLQDRYMCMPCAMEYQRFVQQQLSPDDSGISQQEQLAVIQKLLDEADAHMKQWVSERGYDDAV
jgi:protein-arginine kinase activator protein McsA